MKSTPHFEEHPTLYRLARYADALSWAEKALDSSPAYASAHACAVLSMANWQLGRQSEMQKQVLAQTPLGRLGQPDDIAGAAVFLASPDSSWITGETLVISGGNR